MPRRILHLFAHPALDRSRVNRPLAEAVKGMDGVTHVDLYARYPDFNVDVPLEQAQLVEADVIVFQHPFFWYSSPALLKEWQDLVLEHGFAYGDGGTALAGKALWTVTTTGGVAEAYCAGGHNCFTMEEFLRPFQQTAGLCGMRYLPPFVVHGSHRLDAAGIAAHADRLRAAVARVADPATDLARLEDWEPSAGGRSGVAR
ncbi:MAG: NAD(P)H-dependent oxidoreductase [Planctomycetota bacterium]